MIPCANPQAGYLAQKAAIDDAIHRVLDKGWFILGQEVAAFESEFAAWTGAKQAVGVGSGTEAIHLALAALGVGAGDEVITVSHTAVATTAAIELAGAIPVFLDIDPHFFTINPDLIEAAITPRTKAIVPVHIYGQPADLGPILSLAEKRGLHVIEDCAQCHGAKYRGKTTGTIGHVGCFSFYPTKNLGALGDGGAVVTNDMTLAEKIRHLREYGWTERYVSSLPGWNSRLDELQAAILRVKLKRLQQDNDARAALAELYTSTLGELPIATPRIREGCTHVFHLYVIRTKSRNELQAYLRGRGIHTLIHYPVPIHLQPAYRGRVSQASRLPETERAASEILSFPLYPELSTVEHAQVVESVLGFFKSKQ